MRVLVGKPLKLLIYSFKAAHASGCDESTQIHTKQLRFQHYPQQQLGVSNVFSVPWRFPQLTALQPF